MDGALARGCPRQSGCQRSQLWLAVHEKDRFTGYSRLPGEELGQPMGDTPLQAGPFGRRGQDGERGIGKAVPDLLIQAGRLRLRLDPQLLREGPAAGFVLRQRGTAPAAQRQELHHVTVSCFLPGLYLQPTFRILA